jgi:hypothetical protein
MLQIDLFHFPSFLAQINIKTLLNVRLKLNDASKPFKIIESLINAKSAPKMAENTIKRKIG